MNLTFTFQFSIYFLVALSSIMFMMAEGGVFPQLLTIPLGLLTLFFTDRWNKFSLSPLWGNVLGLLAFLVVCNEFISDIEGRLLAGAHFLVYLTWIILLQKKGETQYWWLAALGFLQIAVGSVLTESGYYGLLLVVYLFLAIWTLSVFSLFRIRNTFYKQETPGTIPQMTVAGDDTSPFRLTSQVKNGVLADQNRQWLTGEFFFATIACSISALFISMCFFLLIPRLWANRTYFDNETLAASRQPMVGFSEKVQLGEMGEILESSERVLELAIYDNETDEPVSVTDFINKFGLDEPLFRGSILSTYKNGSWTRASMDYDRRLLNSRELNTDKLYRQEINLESIGTKVLFIMQPFVGMDMPRDSGNIVNQDTLVVRQKSQPRKGESTKYTVLTAKNAADNLGMNILFEEIDYLRLPRDDIANLIRYTKELIASHPELKSKSEKARLIESHLRDSGEFTYTLNMSIHDPTIDPVEDFLFNRKSGHCEYYASALALMLRAIDIPTRVITGFKGGEQKYLSHQFEVQQRYAHSWVEAYIDYHWVTMDATPTLARAESVAQNAPSLSNLKGVSNMMSQFWSEFVVGVSYQRQKTSFYDPLLRTGKKLGNRLIYIRATMSELLASIKRFLLSPRRWFSWEGGAAVFIITGLFFVVKWLLRMSIKLARMIFRQKMRSQDAVSSANVAFYEKYQSLLATKGFVRSRSETQKEFADQILVDLNAELSQSHIVEYPEFFTELFYEVRYGNHPLQKQQFDEIQEKLRTLESVLLTEKSHKK
ncbi:MAG: DUF3488 and transglutaminase-like domain-containing protein [Planctomycetes bacterium]|nr:DUF3488 and transglutaminase-like domain-containing protein [Planctomycetota bacterium]MCH9727793.1 DUF3488 and transglutaminase-like domain-containing protein [Planctomycetota bacterium]MCH9776388.1 DUF3488 and transglutaminase-like domain-containing protein [Planctomycetota bacterium]